jgi:uncharacterized membrane protein
MTEQSRTIHPDEDIPSLQPWVLMLFAVFIPIVIAFFVPAVYMWLCFGAAAAIFVIALIMLYRQERPRRLDRTNDGTG